MARIQEKVADCESYLPQLTKRADFEQFWQETIDKTKATPLNPEMKRVAYPGTAEVYDIAYNGFDETKICGWLILPTYPKKSRYPCIISYHGFGGSRGTPAQFMHFIAMGVSVLSVDCREQGGITGNAARYTGSGLTKNVVSKGLLNKDEYYYRAVYMDCVKAIDFLQSCEKIDNAAIMVRGTSQGGALGMAVCALDSRPICGIVNVPSNSNIEARVEGSNGSFAAVNEYLRAYPENMARAYETLSYFDTMNMADKITCPIYASVALNDSVCPAKMYYASYNRIKALKEIVVYPFNEHDGAAHIQIERELLYVEKMLETKP
jgi:Acetyl esterase (deacetylase)